MTIKDKLGAARAAAASWLPDALLVGGATSVAAGAGMVYMPAGWIVGGVFALAAGYVLARSSK